MTGSDATVAVEHDGPVCHVTLDRPAKLNALNDEVRQALDDVVDRLRDDTTTRVVVLAGRGPSFSAGADLTARASDVAGTDAATGAGAGTWAQRRHGAGGWQRTLDAWERLPQVTVAAVRGHCIGGAALLAAACDLRIGDSTMQVRIPELAIGIPLTWGGLPRLAREIGLPLTRDLVMTGRVLPADEAVRCGFVQRLVADDLDGAVRAAVEELLAMPAAPLAMTKAMTRALGATSAALAWADADLLLWSRAEPEGRQAAQDYAQRRARKPH